MIEQFTSKEGLNVYVEPTPGIKNLDARIIVQTGSIHESEEAAGISHALEHCLFLSTPEFATKQATYDYATEHAFYKNANTYYTRTIYLTMGLERDAMFHLLGEIVLHPQFGEAATESEMNAIRREAKTRLDNVAGLDAVFNDYIMFGAPYGRRVIGHHDNLNFTEAELVDYYKSRYTLDKTSLLVVGDTSPEEVQNLIEDHFDLSDYRKTYPDHQLPVPTPPYEGEYAFGYLREDSENARISLSVQRPSSLIEKTYEQPWAYRTATSLISRNVFNTLRLDMGLSYNGSFDGTDHNHESARRMTADVTVDPENIDKAITALREILARDPKSYSDDELRRHLNSQRLAAASIVDASTAHADFYADNYLSYGVEPTSAETLYENLQTTTLDQVREALDHIYEIWQSSPEFEAVTGPKEAMGKRAIIAQSLFA